MHDRTFVRKRNLRLRRDTAFAGGKRTETRTYVSLHRVVEAKQHLLLYCLRYRVAEQLEDHTARPNVRYTRR